LEHIFQSNLKCRHSGNIETQSLTFVTTQNNNKMAKKK